MVNNGSGCANPETWLSFAKSCPEILLCEVTASECRGRARGGSASRRRRDWDDGIAGYFKAKHPRLRLTVSKDETSETCRTFESHAKHAGFRRARIQQQKTNQGCRRRRLAAAGWPRYEHRERRIVILHLRQRLMRCHSLFFSRLRVPQGCARTKGACSSGPARGPLPITQQTG